MICDKIYPISAVNLTAKNFNTKDNLEMETKMARPTMFDFEVYDNKMSKEKIEFTLFKSEKYSNCFLITVCDENNFACGSVYSKTINTVKELFDEICDSDTPAYCLSDIVADFNKKAL